MVWATVGASFALATVRRNSLAVLAPAASVAVRRMSSAPTSALAGVPPKVRVAALKASQPGSALPSARVAE